MVAYLSSLWHYTPAYFKTVGLQYTKIYLCFHESQHLVVKEQSHQFPQISQMLSTLPHTMQV